MFTRLVPTKTTGRLWIDKYRLVIPDNEISIVGRAGDPAQARPDVDLSRFGAHEKGVSRRHVQIRRKADAFWVMDLKSNNGTVLNGARLESLTEYPLRDGDELKLGNFVLFVELTAI